MGVIFGSGIGGFTTFQNDVMDFARGDGTPRFNPFFIPKLIADIAAGQISMRHNLRGPNFRRGKCLCNRNQCTYRSIISFKA